MADTADVLANLPGRLVWSGARKVTNSALRASSCKKKRPAANPTPLSLRSRVFPPVRAGYPATYQRAKNGHIKKQPRRDRWRPECGGRHRASDPNLIGGMTPWAVDFRQLEPWCLDTTLRVRQGAVLTLLEIHMNRAVLQNGIAPPDTVTLGIPGSAGQLRWQGEDVTPAEMISFGSSAGLVGVSKVRFLGLSFSAPLPAVAALAERLGLSLADSLWESGVFPDRTDNRQLCHATALACHYLSGAAPTNRNIEEELIACLSRVSAVTGGATDRSSSRTRVRAVRLAPDVMAANVEEYSPIGDIRDRAEVSERTLNRAFNERFENHPATCRSQSGPSSNGGDGKVPESNCRMTG